MLVKEIISRDLVWCTPSDTAQTAVKLMKERGVGIVAQADVALHAPAGLVAKRLAEISKSLKPAREARAAVQPPASAASLMERRYASV